MIDRIAEAIYIARVGRLDNVKPNWSHLIERTKNKFRLEARAVLTVMVAPSDAMLQAGYDCNKFTNACVSVTYPLMIKTALEEK